MRLDDLLKPISNDAPCGEDLLAVDDPDFIDYYFNVDDRLPASYFNLARGTLFDAKSVDHKAETAQIDGLLKRSRDLRLLGLEAKFQILAGRFKGFYEAVLAMAALLETYPDAVLPTDPMDRSNALEELSSMPTVVAPLDYAALLQDRRYGDISYRAYGTSAGRITPREGEDTRDSGQILNAIGSSENAKAVDALFGQINALQDALNRIVKACQAARDPCTPRFERLGEKLGDIREMILAARTDLSGEASAADAAAQPQAALASDGPAPTMPALTVPAPTVPATSPEVPDHRAAYRALRGVERYFATTEPASLALVLVTQSRLLIGRPLVEAIDALLENNASYAKLTFDSGPGFALSMSRMRELSGAAGIRSAEDWAQPSEDDPPALEIISRDHAGAVIKTVEDFYRIREPASPIPILLFKARNMLSKDFHALVRELIQEQ